MSYKTFADVESRVRRELDLIDEPIVTQAEIMDIVNDAIDEVEADILELYEDYFLTSDYISLVAGTRDYAMPTNIYANKLRAVTYSNGSTVYEVFRLKNKDRFLDIADSLIYGGSDDYRYEIENDTSSGPTFRLYPASRETSNTVMRRWYIRQANRIAVTTDVIDILEAYPFIVAYAKWQCAKKALHPATPDYKNDSDFKKQKLLDALTGMVADGHNEIEPDISFYREHT